MSEQTPGTVEQWMDSGDVDAEWTRSDYNWAAAHDAADAALRTALEACIEQLVRIGPSFKGTTQIVLNARAVLDGREPRFPAALEGRAPAARDEAFALMLKALARADRALELVDYSYGGDLRAEIRAAIAAAEEVGP